MGSIGRPPRAKSRARSAISPRKRSAEGYKAGGKPKPYHGYYYRILKRQGAGAPGGAYDYVVKGKMNGGFALIATPAEYGNSGIMTFMVNQDGDGVSEGSGAEDHEAGRQDRRLRAGSGLDQGRQPAIGTGRSRGGEMLRLLMIVSGAFEALFGIAALLATSMVTDAIGTGADPSATFFARMLGAATLGIGIAALLARNELARMAGSPRLWA